MNRKSRTARTRSNKTARTAQRVLKGTELTVDKTQRVLIVKVGTAIIELKPRPARRVELKIFATTNKRHTGAKALDQVRKALVASGLQVSV